MSRFTSEIKRKGKWVGSGCEREAYLFQNKVFKINYSRSGFEQTEVEQNVYSSLPDRFKKFFPNPKWFGRVMVADFVDIYDKRKYQESEQFFQLDSTIYPHKFMDSLSRSNLGDLIAEIQAYDVLPDLMDCLEYFDVAGCSIDDMIDNDGNFGVQDGQIKFVDWGVLRW